MYRRVRIFECVNGDGPRRSEKKTLIWTPWADVRDNTAQTRDQTQISIHALLAESDSKSAQNSGVLLRI